MPGLYTFYDKKKDYSILRGNFHICSLLGALLMAAERVGVMKSDPRYCHAV